VILRPHWAAKMSDKIPSSDIFKNASINHSTSADCAWEIHFDFSFQRTGRQIPHYQFTKGKGIQ